MAAFPTGDELCHPCPCTRHQPSLPAHHAPTPGTRPAPLPLLTMWDTVP